MGILKFIAERIKDPHKPGRIVHPAEDLLRAIPDTPCPKPRTELMQNRPLESMQFFNARYLRRGMFWTRVAQSEEKQLKPESLLHLGLRIFVAQDSVAVHAGKSGNGSCVFRGDLFSDFKQSH